MQHADPAGLRLTEEQLRLAAETAGIGFFELDLKTESWRTTPLIAGLFGLDPRSIQQPLAEWEKPIFQDDRLKLRAALIDAKQSGRFYVEFRVTHPDGSLHWIAAKGEAAPADGVPGWLRGTCTDITQRKGLEVRLLALSETLEARVKDRTQELEASLTQLRESERRFRLLVEGVTDYAIFMLDPGGYVVNWNPGAERLKGYTASEILGQHFSRFYTPEDRQRGMPSYLLDLAATAGKSEAEGWRVRKDGSRFWALVVIHAIRDQDGQLLGFAKVTRDLTERRAAEERMRQAQKMEAVGQLTGGIAHDFNNLLTVISGNLETLQRRLANFPNAAMQRMVEAALHGALRAAVLTHRLLAFSRLQPLDPKPVSVNVLISHMSELLRRALPENVAIETILAGGLWNTFADTNQLESSLLNLAVNARDAMPGGGKLTIEAANIYLDDNYASSAEIPPGQYVGIFVSDTGSGMSPEVIAKAFDPFFTTKEIGQGTGLGLSQVYGFVKQSGGHVKIYSEVGSGTTVKIYLPRFMSAEAVEKPATVAEAPRGKGETILITEDEAEVRQFAADLSRELGYRVIEAPDAAVALRLLDANKEIDLLFTDVGLPGGVNGRQLADEARRRRPGLKVLFTSGYAQNAIVHHGRLDPGVQLITKPFTFTDLALKLRQVLDSP
jgi:PAS domain S-box-containing protein